MFGNHISLPQTRKNTVAFIQGVNDESTINDNVLPTALPAMSQFHKIRLNPMVGDLDITSWMPTGLLPGAEVTFVKEAGSGTLKWTENGIDYTYLEKIGELKTLKWTGSKFVIV